MFGNMIIDHIDSKFIDITAQMNTIKSSIASEADNNDDDENPTIDFQLHDGNEVIEIEAIYPEDSAEVVRAKERKIAKASKKAVEKRGFKIGVCSGHLTTLPPKFNFTNGMTPLQLIADWFIGDKNKNILPYCRLRHKDIVHLDNCGTLKVTHRKMIFL